MAEQDSQPELSVADLYARVRGQIEHEDNLITQRLNWFLTSQSFLFTAFAIVFNGSPPSGPRNVGIRAMLLAVIPIISIIAGLLILIAIFAGVIVMRDLRGWFKKYESRAKSIGLPLIQDRRSTRIMGMFAPVILPISFMVIWTLLAIRAAQ
jgi:hypothetical protein